MRTARRSGVYPVHEQDQCTDATLDMCTNGRLLIRYVVQYIFLTIIPSESYGLHNLIPVFKLKIKQNVYLNSGIKK